MELEDLQNRPDPHISWWGLDGLRVKSTRTNLGEAAERYGKTVIPGAHFVDGDQRTYMKELGQALVATADLWRPYTYPRGIAEGRLEVIHLTPGAGEPTTKSCGLHVLASFYFMRCALSGLVNTSVFDSPNPARVRHFYGERSSRFRSPDSGT